LKGGGGDKEKRFMEKGKRKKEIILHFQLVFLLLFFARWKNKSCASEHVPIVRHELLSLQWNST
jgi:hypothetical protein